MITKRQRPPFVINPLIQKDSYSFPKDYVTTKEAHKTLKTIKYCDLIVRDAKQNKVHVVTLPNYKRLTQPFKDYCLREYQRGVIFPQDWQDMMTYEEAQEKAEMEIQSI